MPVPSWFPQQHRNENVLVQRDTGSPRYYWMLFFATVLATLGILIDNANVIIGAMLIAPLMVPLSALAVAMAHGKFEAVIKALTHVSMSVTLILAVSTALAWLIPVVGIPQEAMLRAQPTVVDLLIALAAGAAGMYAYLHKDIPESLVGVAIAVSLVPPLCVVGVGLSGGAWPLALGATVLFFANVVAILGGSIAVLLVSRRFAQSGEEQGVAKTGWGVTFALTALLAVLLGGAFMSTLKTEQLKERAEKTLRTELESYDTVELQSMKVIPQADQVVVEALIRLPNEAPVPDPEKLTDALVSQLEKPVELQLSALRMELVQKDLPAVEAEPAASPSAENAIDEASSSATPTTEES